MLKASITKDEFEAGTAIIQDIRKDAGKVGEFELVVYCAQAVSMFGSVNELRGVLNVILDHLLEEMKKRIRIDPRLN